MSRIISLEWCGNCSNLDRSWPFHYTIHSRVTGLSITRRQHHVGRVLRDNAPQWQLILRVREAWKSARMWRALYKFGAAIDLAAIIVYWRLRTIRFPSLAQLSPLMDKVTVPKVVWILRPQEKARKYGCKTHAILLHSSESILRSGHFKNA